MRRKQILLAITLPAVPNLYIGISSKILPVGLSCLADATTEHALIGTGSKKIERKSVFSLGNGAGVGSA